MKNRKKCIFCLLPSIKTVKKSKKPKTIPQAIQFGKRISGIFRNWFGFSATKAFKMNLSFAGCGFLGIYHVGVAVCFKKYAPHLLLDKISGASAGCLAATCLLCDMPLGEYTIHVRNRIHFFVRVGAYRSPHSEIAVVHLLWDKKRTIWCTGR